MRNPVAFRSWPKSKSCLSPLLNCRATRISVFAPPSRTHRVITITDPSVHSICTVRIVRFTASSRASVLSVAAISEIVFQPACAIVALSATIANAKIHFFMIFLRRFPGHCGPRNWGMNLPRPADRAQSEPVARFSLASRPRFAP